MQTGVARKPIEDLDAYRDALESRFGKSKQLMRIFIHKAQRAPKRIVFPEGSEDKILRASQIILDEEIATPIVLGDAAANADRHVVIADHAAVRAGVHACVPVPVVLSRRSAIEGDE